MAYLRKIINKEYNPIFFIILSIIFLLYLNIPGFYRVFNNYRADSFSIIFYILPIIIEQMLILTTFSLFIGRIWICLLIFFTAISNYAVHEFGIEIGAGIIQAIAQTNTQETLEAISFLAITKFTLLNASIPMLVIVFIKVKKIDIKNKALLFLKISVIASILWGLPYLANSQRATYASESYVNSFLAPTDVITGIVEYQQIYANALKFLPTNQIIKTEQTNDFSQAPEYKKPMIFVLIIGESQRSDHFSLNGYVRKTTPFLDKRKNLISYQDAISCYTLTMYSVPCLMSLTNMSDFKLPVNHTSITSILKSLDFDTYWLSTHVDTAIFNCKEANTCMLYGDIHKKYKEKYDVVLLNTLDDVLKQSPEKNKFIVINTMSSHVHYNLRYPQTDEFRRFKPICEKFIHDCPISDVINSYDNTIVYSDWVLEQIFKRLEGKNSALIYTSDHAESLGENKVFLHSFHKTLEATPYEQKHVPLIFWASKNFYNYDKLKNPIFEQKLNSEKTIQHDAISHSILDCLGIKSSAINKNQSICNIK